MRDFVTNSLVRSGFSPNLMILAADFNELQLILNPDLDAFRRPSSVIKPKLTTMA